jgi:hypothetical protein
VTASRRYPSIEAEVMRIATIALIVAAGITATAAFAAQTDQNPTPLIH